VVKWGKGRQTRVIPMIAELRDALGDWLEIRRKCSHDFVLTTQSGVRMGKRGLTSALDRALKTAGIGKPGITLHKLRHSFACMLLQNGCDLLSLSTMLGHTRLDTTAIYLEATVEHLRTAIGRHPLAQRRRGRTARRLGGSGPGQLPPAHGHAVPHATTRFRSEPPSVTC
jgi:site-specific recombinase XerD